MQWERSVIPGNKAKALFGITHALPSRVAQWAGTADVPQLRHEGIPYSIAMLNDKGISFKQIANYIEHQL
jgi:hypothetical protein